MKTLSTFSLALILFFIPLAYHAQILFPIEFKWAVLSMLLPVAVFLGPVRKALQGETWKWPAPQTPILLLFALSVLSLLWAGSFSLALRSILLLGVGILISCCVLNSEISRRNLLLIILAAGSLASIYGLLQSRGIDPLFALYNRQFVPVSTFGNTNYATEFCAPLIAIAFVYATRSSGMLGRFAVISLFLLSGYLSVAQVRAGMIAGAVALLVSVFLVLRSQPRKQRPLLIAPCLAVVLGFLAPRIYESGQETNAIRSKLDTVEVRKRIYLSTLELIQDNPILGCGVGQFPIAYAPYRDPKEIWLSSHERKDSAESMVEEPHNDYLLYSAELGLLGAVLLGWIGIWVLKQQKTASWTNEGMICFAGLCAIGVNALFRSPLTNPSSQMLFWAFLGILSLEIGTQSITGKQSSRAIAVFALLLSLITGYFGWRTLCSEKRLSQFFETQERNNLEESVSYAPWDFRKWDILAAYQRDLWKDPAAAETSYRRLLEIHPNHFGARLNLGLLLQRRGELETAQREINWARRLDPEHPLLR